MADLINTTDSLNTGRKKLNDAIKDSNEAFLKANQSAVISEAARILAESVQEQFNQVVIDGDSSVEAAQARVDGSGQTFSTLKQRLDTKENDITGKLQQTASSTDKSVIFVEVSSTNTALQNNNAIENAIEKAKIKPSKLVFPAIEGNIVVTQKHILDFPLEISGAYTNTVLRVGSALDYVFDVRSPNVFIHDLTFRGGETSSGAILITTDNVTIDRVVVQYLTYGVRVMAWDISNNTPRATLPTNVSVTDLTSEFCCFPLLVEGSKDFYFNNIRGSYKLIGSRAPHLIYFSDGRNTVLADTSTPLGENINPIGGVCYAYDSVDSYPYQFKYVRGGNIEALNSRGCRGLLNVLESSDLTISALNAIDDKLSVFGYGAIDFDGVCRNITVKRANIFGNTENGKILRMSTSVSDSTVEDLTAHVTGTSTPSADYYHVQLYGTNNKLINPKIHNDGVPWYASIGIFGGDGHTIENPECSGDYIGVVSRGLGVNRKINGFDSSKVNFVTGQAYAKHLDLSNTSTSVREVIKNTITDRDIIAYDNCLVGSGSANILSVTTSNHIWEIGFGTWRSREGVIFNTNGINSVALINCLKNVELSATLKVANREALILRGTDYNNWLGVRLNQTTNTLEILKRKEGAITVLSSVPYVVSVGRKYKLKIQAFENTIDVYVDAAKTLTHILSVEDNAFFNVEGANKSGLQANGLAEGTFGNLVWRKLE